MSGGSEGVAAQAALRVVWLLLPAVLGACSLSTPPFVTPPASELPRLESAVRMDSTDVRAVTALAAGYVAQDRVQAARDLLEGALRRRPTEPTLVLMLGLVEEDLGLYESAAVHFAAYSRAYGGPVAWDVRGRLDAVRVPALRARGARLVADRSGADLPAPDPERVVVIPFSRSEQDADLATGLTWLLSRNVTNRGLQDSGRLVMQGILGEMGFDPTQTPPLSMSLAVATLLGAGHVIQGHVSVDGEGSLSWDVMVVTVRADGSLVVSSVPAEGTVDDAPALAAQVASVAKQIVRGARSVTQEADVELRPPQRGDALLAFGRAIGEAEAGEWAAAQSDFQVAADSDSSFDEAAEWALRSEAAVETASEPLLAALEAGVRIGELRRSVLAIRGATGPSEQVALSLLGSHEREEVAEVLGLDRLGAGGLVSVTIGLESGGAP